MANLRSHHPVQIDFQRSQPWQPILPTPPILSSHTARWKALHLEHHRQPAHVTPDYSLPQHTLVVCLEYRASELKINGRTYQQMMSGNIGLAPAGQPLSTEAFGAAEYLLLAMSPQILANAVGDQIDGDRLELTTQLFGQDPLIYQMALALRGELATNQQDSELYAESMAIALAAHLVRRYSNRTEALPVDETAHGLPNYKLREAIAYIHDRLSQKIALSDLAVSLQLSPYYFGRLFKQSTGLSPYQYVLKVRIDRARQLLADPGWAIADIALEVGFQNQSHFTRVFRQQLGTTPKAYRDAL